MDDTDRDGMLKSDEFDLGSASPKMESLEESTELSAGDRDAELYTCRHCSQRYTQPRVLSCLHVFCTPCLEQLSHGEGGVTPTRLAAGVDFLQIACPVCCQETKITSLGALPLDVILMNMMDVADIHAMQMLCTSCKAQERAVARCSDCASFLCPHCVSAHKLMRCFENHKVESFEDLQKDKSINIHKPFFCKLHHNESLRYFCNTCQIPVCTECMMSVHRAPEHMCERIGDIEIRLTSELRSLVNEARSKVMSPESASAEMSSMLTDLQQQRDSAHDLIKETYQSYKAILEKKQDELLRELYDTHKANELAVMEIFNSVTKMVDRIEDGCRFTERILEHGNGVEVLSMKKHVIGQLQKLAGGMPRLEPNVNKIVFKTNPDTFEAMINMTFGHLIPHSKALLNGHGEMKSSFDGEHFPGMSSLSPSTAELSPMLSGLSDMTSSQELIPGLTPGFHGGHGLGGTGPLGSMAVQPPLSLATTLTGHGFGALDRSTSRSSYSPSSLSDSGLGLDSAASAFSASNLSKLGLGLGLNAQGQLLLNGQALPGLNLPPQANMPPVSDAATLAGLLHSVSLTTPTTPLPPVTPQLSEFGGLFDVRSAAGHPLLGANSMRSGSPITAASLLTAPPPGAGLQLTGAGSAIRSVPPVGLGFGGDSASSMLRVNRQKSNPMNIRHKFGQLGPSKGQFNSPHGFCLGVDEDIVVADTNNHRIQVFEKNGEFKYQFGTPGREEGQLWYPRKVAVIRSSGKYVICDRGSERSRMQLFTKTGQFIRKISIRYIDIVAGLAITQQGNIVAVDSVSPTVFCISEAGELLRWFDCSDYMREPSDIAVCGKEYYICDFKGHCVVVFNEEGQFMHRIGAENITNYPNGIDISDAGDVLIGDSHGNRFHVAVFQRDGSLIGEFECPYVKVSRCCGLKITSEGYVVTLAKNNQHVLVLDTLYIA